MNDTLQRALGDVPWRIWLFIILQGAAILIWGVRIDWRVGTAEQKILDLHLDFKALEMEHRLIQNRLAVLEERQARTTETNQNQQRQIDYIIQWFSPHVTPPGPLPSSPSRPSNP